MKRIAVLIATLALGLTALVSGQSAQAVSPGLSQDHHPSTDFPGDGDGGFIDHLEPDNGFDGPIVIFCDYGDAFDVDGGHDNWQESHTSAADWDTRKLVYEGGTSKTKCPSSEKHFDTDVIWVRPGEEITCRFWRSYVGGGEYYWKVMWDAYGPHKISDLGDYRCVIGTD